MCQGGGLKECAARWSLPLSQVFGISHNRPVLFGLLVHSVTELVEIYSGDGMDKGLFRRAVQSHFKLRPFGFFNRESAANFPSQQIRSLERQELFLVFVVNAFHGPGKLR